MPRITPAARAAAYVAWIDRTGLVPSRRSPDPAERALFSSYLYLHGKDRKPAEQEAYETMTKARESAALARREMGEARRSFKPRGLVTARRVAAFHEVNGRLPLNRIESERKLYADLRNLRHRRTTGELSAEAVEVLDAVPGVFAVVRRPPLPELRKLEAWCAANGRMPRHDINRDRTPAEDQEIHFGRWLYRHLHRRHNPAETDQSRMIRTRIHALQDTYPPASAVKDSARAREVLDFIEAEGRLPDWSHDWLIFMSTFALRRRYAGRSGRFGADIAAFLEATRTLPSPVESRWDGRFADLEDFTRAEGCLPSGAADGSFERELAAWLGSAAGIHDPERAAALAAFLDDMENRPAA